MQRKQLLSPQQAVIEHNWRADLLHIKGFKIVLWKAMVKDTTICNCSSPPIKGFKTIIWKTRVKDKTNCNSLSPKVIKSAMVDACTSANGRYFSKRFTIFESLYKKGGSRITNTYNWRYVATHLQPTTFKAAKNLSSLI
jgi:hypothetical protein